jgi:hypothetical protein
LSPQELPPRRIGVPGRCRGYAPQLEDPADGRCSDAVAELEKFTLDSLVAPGLVLAGHSFDQRGDGVIDVWATGPVRVGPLLGDQAAVPAQDRARSDQAMAAQYLG